MYIYNIFLNYWFLITRFYNVDDYFEDLTNGCFIHFKIWRYRAFSAGCSQNRTGDPEPRVQSGGCHEGHGVGPGHGAGPEGHGAGPEGHGGSS